MAYVKIKDRVLNPKFIIEHYAFEIARKMYSIDEIKEREAFLQGVRYAVKHYQRLINNQNGKMD